MFSIHFCTGFDFLVEQNVLQVILKSDYRKMTNKRLPMIIGMPLANVIAYLYTLQVRIFIQHKHIHTSIDMPAIIGSHFSTKYYSTSPRAFVFEVGFELMFIELTNLEPKIRIRSSKEQLWCL